MTTPHDQYDIIRLLLARYYDGKTSPEENSQLSAMLESVDVKNMPDDLADDAALFNLMKNEEDRLADTVPTGLEENLRLMLSDPKPAFMRRGRLIRFVFKISASAAALALLVTVGLRNLSKTDPIETDGTENALLTIVLPEVPVEDQDNEAQSILAVAAPKTEPKANAIARVSAPVINDTPDNFIEITDAIEACMLAQDALALVREKLALASYSLSSASDGVRQIDYAMNEVIINKNPDI